MSGRGRQVLLLAAIALLFAVGLVLSAGSLDLPNGDADAVAPMPGGMGGTGNRAGAGGPGGAGAAADEPEPEPEPVTYRPATLVRWEFQAVGLSQVGTPVNVPPGARDITVEITIETGVVGEFALVGLGTCDGWEPFGPTSSAALGRLAATSDPCLEVEPGEQLVGYASGGANAVQGTLAVLALIPKLTRAMGRSGGCRIPGLHPSPARRVPR